MKLFAESMRDVCLSTAYPGSCVASLDVSEEQTTLVKLASVLINAPAVVSQFTFLSADHAPPLWVLLTRRTARHDGTLRELQNLPHVCHRRTHSQVSLAMSAECIEGVRASSPVLKVLRPFEIALH